MNIKMVDKQAVISMPKWLFWVLAVPWIVVAFLTAVEYIIEDGIKIVGWLSG